MTEHKLTIGESTFTFAALGVPDFKTVEQNKKNDAVRAWLETCKELRVDPITKRVQITELLMTPMQPSLADLERLIRFSLAKAKGDASDDTLRMIAKHGNSKDGKEDMTALIEFLYSMNGAT